MSRADAWFWIVEYLPLPPARGRAPRALTWQVLDGPFTTQEAAIAYAQTHPPHPRWAIVAAADRRRAVLAAHRAVGLPLPPRDGIP
jgi:hypothetical protein